MEKKHTFSFWYFIFASMVLLFAQFLWVTNQQIETIPYSQFQSMLHDGKISEVVVAEKYMQGTLKTPSEAGQKYVLAVKVAPDIAQQLTATGVKFSGLIETTWLRDLLSWVVPIVLFFVIWQYLIRRMSEGQGMGSFMAIGQIHPEHRASEATEADIDRGIRRLVDAAFARASKILADRKDLLERGAEQLLLKETMTAAELAEFKIERLPALP
eukprot:gene10640-10711_t